MTSRLVHFTLFRVLSHFELGPRTARAESTVAGTDLPEIDRDKKLEDANQALEAASLAFTRAALR